MGRENRVCVPRGRGGGWGLCASTPLRLR
uniref:Uncharacterized protein n=1 Tax=Anguilla anguilla TaxID=7936 RepID=A0A0E9TU32_ANGAN